MYVRVIVPHNIRRNAKPLLQQQNDGGGKIDLLIV